MASKRPNWNQGRRDELARQKFTALGMRPPAKGAYNAWRKLPVETRARGVARMAERRANYIGGGANVKRQQVREVRFGDTAGRVVTSSSERVLMQQLRAAAAAGQTITITSYWRTDEGSRRSVIGGDQQGRRSGDRIGDKPEGKVSIAVGVPGGVDAQAVLDYLLMFGDIWEYLADYFDQEDEY